MTVESTTSRAQYETNGTTGPWTVPFYFLANTHLRVVYTDIDGNEIPLELGVHYTVLGAGNDDGGSVDTVEAYPAGGYITILRRVPRTQETDYTDQDAFPAESHERALDKLTMIVLEQDESLQRTIRLPVTTEGDQTLPVGERSNSLVGFDALGRLAYYAIQVGTSIVDLATSLGASLIGWVQAGLGAIKRTVLDKLRDHISAFDYMTEAESADVRSGALAVPVTALMSRIMAAYPNGNVSVHLPRGSYLVTDEWLINKHRVHLRGEGPWATRLVFRPTANGKACLKVADGANMVVQGSIKSLSIWSDDSTYSKIGIELVDTAGYALEDVAIGGSVEAVSGSFFWSGGAASTGLVTRGREACSINRFYCYADRPIHIRDNPNHSIDIDHFHFHDCYLAAAGNPVVTIDSGINETNVTFDGYQIWVLGTYGLYWVDTSSSIVSQTFVLRGVRWEQGQDSSAWLVRIEHNHSLQGLAIDDCQGGVERNGYYLRNVTGFSMRNNINGGGAGRTVLDVDASVQGMDWRECLWQVGASANMAGQLLVQGGPNPQTGAPLPPTARYQSANVADRRLHTDLANGGKRVVVANGDVIALGDGTTAGILMVVDSEGLSAIFALRGTYHTVDEIADPAPVYSTTAGTSSSTNIYWSAGNNRYELQNNRGTERRYLIALMGTYTAF